MNYEHTLKNLCSSSCCAVGRLLGSFIRHFPTMSRIACMSRHTYKNCCQVSKTHHRVQGYSAVPGCS